MALTKHEFIDDYHYLVYTDVQTCVYSDKADTSINDIGGGGSVTLGNLAGGVWTLAAVSVGASASESTFLETTQVKIGDTIVVDSAGQLIQYVAGGADAIALYSSDNPLTFTQAYDVTIDIDTHKYATVEEIDMDVVSTTVEIEGETVPAWEYTVPSIAEGHYYVLKFTE